MNSRHKRILFSLLGALVALAGSAAVLPMGARERHAVVPAAAIGSLALAVLGFICLLLAVVSAVGYGDGRKA
ncbi:MAG: hypothetical protein JO041_03140 [Acidobacteria bacterium]|nr:hypothetical protein [Acidobacteriota bacterium]